MRGKVTDVHIDAVLHIDDQDAEVLGYLLDREVTQLFQEKMRTKFSIAEIDVVFSQLRNACAKVTQAKKRALRALGSES